MTALNNPIVFSSSGSDTAASGSERALGSSVVSGQVQWASGQNYGTLSTTTGLSVGDLLFAPTSTGRRFNVISLIVGSTVYFDSAWDSSENGTAFYVGGQRQTFDETSSRRIFENDASNWEIETESDQTLTSALRVQSSGLTGGIIRGSGARRTITQTVNEPIFEIDASTGLFQFQNLQLKNNFTGGTKTSGHGIEFVAGVSSSNPISCFDCIFGDSTDSLRMGIDGNTFNWSLNVMRCVFNNCQVGMIQTSGGGGLNANIVESVFNDSVAEGLYVSGAGDANLAGCIVSNSGGTGLYSTSRVNVSDSVFYNNGGHGISTLGEQMASTVVNSVFVDNGSFGINSGVQSPMGLVADCSFFGNSSGQISKAGLQSNIITLTGDPFQNSGSGNFQLNQTAGEGQDVRDVEIALSSTTTHPMLRYTNEAAAGGGSIFHPLGG
jgi:hypothetical protein